MTDSDCDSESFRVQPTFSPDINRDKSRYNEVDTELATISVIKTEFSLDIEQDSEPEEDPQNYWSWEVIKEEPHSPEQTVQSAEDSLLDLEDYYLNHHNDPGESSNNFCENSTNSNSRHKEQTDSGERPGLLSDDSDDDTNVPECFNSSVSRRLPEGSAYRVYNEIVSSLSKTSRKKTTQLKSKPAILRSASKSQTSESHFCDEISIEDKFTCPSGEIPSELHTDIKEDVIIRSVENQSIRSASSSLCDKPKEHRWLSGEVRKGKKQKILTYTHRHSKERESSLHRHQAETSLSQKARTSTEMYKYPLTQSSEPHETIHRSEFFSSLQLQRCANKSDQFGSSVKQHKLDSREESDHMPEIILNNEMNTSEDLNLQYLDSDSFLSSLKSHNHSLIKEANKLNKCSRCGLNFNLKPRLLAQDFRNASANYFHCFFCCASFSKASMRGFRSHLGAHILSFFFKCCNRELGFNINFDYDVETLMEKYGSKSKNSKPTAKMPVNSLDDRNSWSKENACHQNDDLDQSAFSDGEYSVESDRGSCENRCESENEFESRAQYVPEISETFTLNTWESDGRFPKGPSLASSKGAQAQKSNTNIQVISPEVGVSHNHKILERPKNNLSSIDKRFFLVSDLKPRLFTKIDLNVNVSNNRSVGCKKIMTCLSEEEIEEHRLRVKNGCARLPRIVLNPVTNDYIKMYNSSLRMQTRIKNKQVIDSETWNRKVCQKLEIIRLESQSSLEECKSCSSNFVKHSKVDLLTKMGDLSPCSKCFSNFYSKHLFEKHVMARHPFAEPFLCYLCQFKCQTWAQFVYHIKLHDINRYLCQDCSISVDQDVACSQEMLMLRAEKANINFGTVLKGWHIREQPMRPASFNEDLPSMDVVNEIIGIESKDSPSSLSASCIKSKAWSIMAPNSEQGTTKAATALVRKIFPRRRKKRKFSFRRRHQKLSKTCPVQSSLNAIGYFFDNETHKIVGECPEGLKSVRSMDLEIAPTIPGTSTERIHDALFNQIKASVIALAKYVRKNQEDFNIFEMYSSHDAEDSGSKGKSKPVRDEESEALSETIPYHFPKLPSYSPHLNEIEPPSSPFFYFEDENDDNISSLQNSLKQCKEILDKDVSCDSDILPSQSLKSNNLPAALILDEKSERQSTLEQQSSDVHSQDQSSLIGLFGSSDHSYCKVKSPFSSINIEEQQSKDMELSQPCGRASETTSVDSSLLCTENIDSFDDDDTNDKISSVGPRVSFQGASQGTSNASQEAPNQLILEGNETTAESIGNNESAHGEPSIHTISDSMQPNSNSEDISSFNIEVIGIHFIQESENSTDHHLDQAFSNSEEHPCTDQNECDVSNLLQSSVGGRNGLGFIDSMELASSTSRFNPHLNESVEIPPLKYLSPVPDSTGKFEVLFGNKGIDSASLITGIVLDSSKTESPVEMDEAIMCDSQNFIAEICESGQIECESESGATYNDHLRIDISTQSSGTELNPEVSNVAGAHACSDSSTEPLLQHQQCEGSTDESAMPLDLTTPSNAGFNSQPFSSCNRSVLGLLSRNPLRNEPIINRISSPLDRCTNFPLNLTKYTISSEFTAHSMSDLSSDDEETLSIIFGASAEVFEAVNSLLSEVEQEVPSFESVHSYNAPGNLKAWKDRSGGASPTIGFQSFNYADSHIESIANSISDSSSDDEETVSNISCASAEVSQAVDSLLSEVEQEVPGFESTHKYYELENIKMLKDRSHGASPIIGFQSFDLTDNCIDSILMKEEMKTRKKFSNGTNFRTKRAVKRLCGSEPVLSTGSDTDSNYSLRLSAHPSRVFPSLRKPVKKRRFLGKQKDSNEVCNSLNPESSKISEEETKRNRKSRKRKRGWNPERSQQQAIICRQQGRGSNGRFLTKAQKSDAEPSPSHILDHCYATFRSPLSLKNLSSSHDAVSSAIANHFDKSECESTADYPKDEAKESEAHRKGPKRLYYSGKKRRRSRKSLSSNLSDESDTVAARNCTATMKANISERFKKRRQRKVYTADAQRALRSRQSSLYNSNCESKESTKKLSVSDNQTSIENSSTEMQGSREDVRTPTIQAVQTHKELSGISTDPTSTHSSESIEEPSHHNKQAKRKKRRRFARRFCFRTLSSKYQYSKLQKIPSVSEGSSVYDFSANEAVSSGVSSEAEVNLTQSNERVKSHTKNCRINLDSSRKVFPNSTGNKKLVDQEGKDSSRANLSRVRSKKQQDDTCIAETPKKRRKRNSKKLLLTTRKKRTVPIITNSSPAPDIIASTDDKLARNSGSAVKKRRKRNSKKLLFTVRKRRTAVSNDLDDNTVITHTKYDETLNHQKRKYQNRKTKKLTFAMSGKRTVVSNNPVTINNAPNIQNESESSQKSQLGALNEASKLESGGVKLKQQHHIHKRAVSPQKATKSNVKSEVNQDLNNVLAESVEILTEVLQSSNFADPQMDTNFSHDASPQHNVQDDPVEAKPHEGSPPFSTNSQLDSILSIAKTNLSDNSISEIEGLTECKENVIQRLSHRANRGNRLTEFCLMIRVPGLPRKPKPNFIAPKAKVNLSGNKIIKTGSRQQKSTRRFTSKASNMKSHQSGRQFKIVRKNRLGKQSDSMQIGTRAAEKTKDEKNSTSEKPSVKVTKWQESNKQIENAVSKPRKGCSRKCSIQHVLFKRRWFTRLLEAVNFISIDQLKYNGNNLELSPGDKVNSNVRPKSCGTKGRKRKKSFRRHLVLRKGKKGGILRQNHPVQEVKNLPQSSTANRQEANRFPESLKNSKDSPDSKVTNTMPVTSIEAEKVNHLDCLPSDVTIPNIDTYEESSVEPKNLEVKAEELEYPLKQKKLRSKIQNLDAQFQLSKEKNKKFSERKKLENKAQVRFLSKSEISQCLSAESLESELSPSSNSPVSRKLGKNLRLPKKELRKGYRRRLTSEKLLLESSISNTSNEKVENESEEEDGCKSSAEKLEDVRVHLKSSVPELSLSKKQKQKVETSHRTLCKPSEARKPLLDHLLTDTDASVSSLCSAAVEDTENNLSSPKTERTQALKLFFSVNLPTLKPAFSEGNKLTPKNDAKLPAPHSSSDTCKRLELPKSPVSEKQSKLPEISSENPSGFTKSSDVPSVTSPSSQKKSCSEPSFDDNNSTVGTSTLSPHGSDSVSTAEVLSDFKLEKNNLLECRDKNQGLKSSSSVIFPTPIQKAFSEEEKGNILEHMAKKISQDDTKEPKSAVHRTLSSGPKMAKISPSIRPKSNLPHYQVPLVNECEGRRNLPELQDRIIDPCNNQPWSSAPASDNRIYYPHQSEIGHKYHHLNTHLVSNSRGVWTPPNVNMDQCQYQEMSHSSYRNTVYGNRNYCAPSNQGTFQSAAFQPNFRNILHHNNYSKSTPTGYYERSLPFDQPASHFYPDFYSNEFVTIPTSKREHSNYQTSSFYSPQVSSEFSPQKSQALSIPDYNYCQIRPADKQGVHDAGNCISSQRHFHSEPIASSLTNSSQEPILSHTDESVYTTL